MRLPYHGGPEIYFEGLKLIYIGEILLLMREDNTERRNESSARRD
jgi:hypothetical protein